VARRLAAMRQRVEDACTERDDALAELQNTVQELDALQSQLDRITDAYEAKVDTGTGLEEDIALAVQRTDAAEKRAQELDERVSALQAELERAIAELAEEREARARLEAEAAEKANATSALEEPVAETTDSAAEQEAERAALEAAHSETVARLESELEAIRTELDAERQAHAAQREEAAGMHAERYAATQELQSAQAQLASLTDERDAGASEIARLSASLSEAEERVYAAQQRAAELAENLAASEQAGSADVASPVAAVDPQEVEALKAQIAREADSHAAAIGEARENMKKWSDYANGLKQQLAQANEKMIVVHARGAGEASLSRRLAAELGAVNPEHELLRKDVQQRVIVEAISAQLEQQGYHYDTKTGVVSKLNTESAPA
jgi:DNA repair exonuclease SbcCD ATPase subunit